MATAADQRHKGYMRQVLYKMLQDLNQEKKPFCFLMPAAEAIYRPFQFAFIYDQPVWKPEDEPEKDLEKRPVDLAKKAETAAHWMNDWLEKHYEVYAVRDKAYMELLKKELESEAGEVTGWYEKTESFMHWKPGGDLERGKNGFITPYLKSNRQIRIRRSWPGSQM